MEVVITPWRMPTVSCSTLATGARQFVVHDAFETTWWRRGRRRGRSRRGRSSRPASLSGAETSTLRAPARGAPPPRWRVRKRPVALEHDVDASAAQGSCRVGRRNAGSATPSMTSRSPSAWTSSREAPVDRVVLEQVGERVDVGDVVDRRPTRRQARLVGGAETPPADPAEPVDGDTNGHVGSFLWKRLTLRLVPAAAARIGALPDPRSARDRRSAEPHQVFGDVACWGAAEADARVDATQPSGRAITGFRSSSATSGRSSASRPRR